jgi:hypothetical protein
MQEDGIARADLNLSAIAKASRESFEWSMRL